jgi:DNA-binding MarR family transcriptional regulator
MDLSNLIKPIDMMSDEELLERIKELRHRREVLRPAATAHKQKAAKKKVAPVVNKLEKLLAGMSEEERAELLRSLEGDL